MLLNSDESNFARLSEAEMRDGLRSIRFARVPKHSLGDSEARFIACIITPATKHASRHHFSTSNLSDSQPICINAIPKREVMHHVIKNEYAYL